MLKFEGEVIVWARSRPAVVALALTALVGCGQGPDHGTRRSAVKPASHVRGVPSSRSGTVPRRLGRLVFLDGDQLHAAPAGRGGKPWLLFFTAEWSPYCREMVGTTFLDDRVAALSGRFTCVLVDADRHADVCRRYGVRGYPTLQFVSPRGVPLNRLVGKQTPSQLVEAMHAALNAVARRSRRESSRRF